MPKPKLCAKCVAANLEVVNAPKSAIVPLSAYGVALVKVAAARKPKQDLFATLLAKMDEETVGSEPQPSTRADLAIQKGESKRPTFWTKVPRARLLIRSDSP